MASKRKRGRKHPGVTLITPREASRTGWRARYEDPDTERMTWETLDVALATSELREDWAVRKSKALGRRRIELEQGAGRNTGTTLGDALKRYWKDHPHLRPRTLEIYRRAAGKLEAWAGANRAKSADDLTGPKLVAFRAELVREPKRAPEKGAKRGAAKGKAEPRAPGAVNVELRAVGTVLGYLRRLGLLPRLSSDDLKDGLRRLAVSHDRNDYRKPAELQKLLEAAQRHDAAVFAATRDEHAGKRPLGSTARYTPIAPLLAAAMLTGMRAGELLDLEWKQVDLEALDNEGRTVGEIHLSSATKTKRARTVGLEVSPALRRLLAAMHLKSGGTGSVFGVTRGELKAAERRLLAEFGAPEGGNMQALRRTCGTYLTNSPGIFGAASAYRSAKQLGHSVAVAERHYVDVARGIPREARTLEDAMQIGEQVEDVIDAVAAPKVASVRKIG